MSSQEHRALGDLTAEVDASESEIAAGKVVSAATIEAKIQRAIDRLEARLQDAPRAKGPPGR